MSIYIMLALLLSPEAPYQPDFLLDTPLELSGSPNYGAQDPQYTDCVELLIADLETGREGARTWVHDGGGAPAIHCLAIADLAAGYPRLAAVRLAELAEQPAAGEADVRAMIYAQAALAWLDAENPDLAVSAAESAVMINANAGDLHIISAKAYFAAGQLEKTVEAIERAETHGAVSAEGFLLSARAHKALGRNTDAGSVLVRALQLDPFNLDALVLRGDLIQAGVAIRADYQPVTQKQD